MVICGEGSFSFVPSFKSMQSAYAATLRHLIFDLDRRLAVLLFHLRISGTTLRSVRYRIPVKSDNTTLARVKRFPYERDAESIIPQRGMS
jgi:hypothetical protein